MSLLKQIIQNKRQQDLINESAAAGSTSAGSVAGFRGHFFSPVSKKKKKKKKTKMRRRAMPTGHTFALRFEGVEDSKFDSADVISKLKSAEQKAEHEEDTTGFALEDEDGNIVKVFVAAEQAKDFETALGAALAGADEDNEEAGDDENTSLEIAEVLFNLKDRFTIVDVEWPEIEEDQEEDVEMEGGGDAEGDLDVDVKNAEGGEEGEGEEGGMEAALQGEEGDDLGLEGGEGELDGETDTASTLDSVIELLKAQADAQKAEANAKEAEANAEEAKHNASAAESKVKQEEDVLDMETYYDNQGKIDKEAKQLAKLAKWKHETAQSASNKMKGEAGKFQMPEGSEEEELDIFDGKGTDKNRDHKLQPGEFIKYMFRSIQGN